METEYQLTVHFIRHGKTEANTKKLYLSYTDQPIIAEEHDRIKKLKSEGFFPETDMIFTSGLLRTKETASCVYPKEEYKALFMKFNGQINGSNGNYAIYNNARRYLWLNLFVHDRWEPIRFDIRNDFLKATNGKKIYEEAIKKISKLLAKERLFLYVDYDPKTNTYTLLNKDSFLEILVKLLK